MTIDFRTPNQKPDTHPRLVVMGIGGAGCNAVNHMIESDLEGFECVVANTDAQSLARSLAERKVQLGVNSTQGLGAGARPEIGRAAAEEALDSLMAPLDGAHMLFIAAGMGGGTGTGGAPVIARAARELGVLTVGVVTKPFDFEGQHRMRIAEAGIEELAQAVDTLIVIPNQKLFGAATEKTTFADAFRIADGVLGSGVRGITDLMMMPGLINLDFADVQAVMGAMGRAMLGAGEADGEDRALKAAEAAISNPLLELGSMTGAHGLLINITGGSDLTLYEVDQAASRVRDEADPDANIIFGSAFDATLEGRIRVSVIATGIDSAGVDATERVARSSIALEPCAGDVTPEPDISNNEEVVSETASEETKKACDVIVPFERRATAQVSARGGLQQGLNQVASQQVGCGTVGTMVGTAVGAALGMSVGVARDRFCEIDDAGFDPQSERPDAETACQDDGENLVSMIDPSARTADIQADDQTRELVFAKPGEAGPTV